MTVERKPWKKIEAVVRATIIEWDPYGLIGGGAPDHEWDSEILQIVGRVHDVSTAEGAASTIACVFSNALQPDDVQGDECAEVGKKLFDTLKMERLL